MAVAGGMGVGAGLERSDARFDGAVVARPVGRREEMSDVPHAQQLLHPGFAEGGAVVALEHQGRAVGREQAREQRGGVCSGGVFDRLPEERHPAGQVADGEQVGEAAVDGRRGFGEVDGPDAAGFGPVQHAKRDAMTHAPDAAIATQEIVLLGAEHVGEALAEGRQADAWAMFVEEVQERVADFAR